MRGQIREERLEAIEVGREVGAGYLPCTRELLDTSRVQRRGMGVPNEMPEASKLVNSRCTPPSSASRSASARRSACISASARRMRAEPASRGVMEARPFMHDALDETTRGLLHADEIHGRPDDARDTTLGRSG